MAPTLYALASRERKVNLPALPCPATAALWTGLYLEKGYNPVVLAAGPGRQANFSLSTFSGRTVQVAINVGSRRGPQGMGEVPGGGGQEGSSRGRGEPWG